MRTLLRFVLLMGLVWSLTAAVQHVAVGGAFTFRPPLERERALAAFADRMMLLLVRPLGLAQTVLPGGLLRGYGLPEQAVNSGLWALASMLLGGLRRQRQSTAA